jgi:hypothetical protein
MRLRAISQIHHGSPGNFGVVEPGEDFETSKIGLADIEVTKLLAAGHAVPFSARTIVAATAPTSPVVAIPADWEKLKAKEAVDLARQLGASDTVSAEDAAAFVRRAVADRLAGR